MEIAAKSSHLALDLGEELYIGKRMANGARFRMIDGKPPQIRSDAHTMRGGVALDLGASVSLTRAYTRG